MCPSLRSSSAVTIGPGQGFEFASFTFRLGSCQTSGSTIACSIQIETSSMGNRLQLKPRSLSANSSRFRMNFGENRFSYSHGPSVSQDYDLSPSSKYEGKIVFESPGKDISNRPDLLERYSFSFLAGTATGERILITLKPL